jgi:hypothetical protein
MFFAKEGKAFVSKILYPSTWVFTNVGAIAILYSRLHLIIDAPRALKWLGWILIGIGIPFHVFLVVASHGNSKKTWYLGLAVHNVAYRLETIINLTEIALSIAYIYFFTTRFMRDGPSGFQVTGLGKGNQLQWTFIILILGELFVIAGDIAIVTVWLTDYFLVRLAIAPLVYGTKLKVEFLILNCLTGMTQQRAELRHITISTGDHTNEAVLAEAEMAAAAVLRNSAPAELRRSLSLDDIISSPHVTVDVERAAKHA